MEKNSPSKSFRNRPCHWTKMLCCRLLHVQLAPPMLIPLQTAEELNAERAAIKNLPFFKRVCHGESVFQSLADVAHVYPASFSFVRSVCIGSRVLLGVCGCKCNRFNKNLLFPCTIYYCYSPRLDSVIPNYYSTYYNPSPLLHRPTSLIVRKVLRVHAIG